MSKDMTTLRDSIQPFKAAVALERLVGRRTLDRLRHIGFFVFFCGAAISAFLYYLPDILPEFTPYRNISAGLSLFGLALYIDSFLAKCYHNSHYFKGLRSVMGLEEAPQSGATYDVARAVLKKPEDVAYAFVTSAFGQTALLRSNVPLAEIERYLGGQRQQITAAMVTLPDHEIFSLIGLGKYLLTHDTAFADLIKRQGVQGEDFVGALRWVIGTYHAGKHAARFWSRDNLSRSEGIGTELSYGVAYLLQKFSRDIRTSAIFSTLTRDSAFAAETVTKIEETLAKGKAANVLLVGEAGLVKLI